MKKILMIGPPIYNHAFHGLWDDVEFISGHETVPASLDWKSLYAIVFTGGPDVSPHMYGEVAHAETVVKESRDLREKALYNIAQRHGIPKIGICRGAQLLNVLNGGKLHQHIPNHGRTHPVNLLMRFGDFPDQIMISSTHHQMMIPTPEADLLAYSSGLAFKEGSVEPEVVYYPRTQSLCVQYHPENMAKDSPGHRYFQTIVKELI